jgi:hypothetical protein
MLKQEVYEWCSDTFGVSVGLATIISLHSKDSEEGKVFRKKYNRFDEELDINEIITDSIEEGNYKELQRELYRLKRKGFSPKIKEVTIYKRAWNEAKKEVTNKDDIKKGNRAKPTKV